jgi:hypothetical protein
LRGDLSARERCRRRNRSPGWCSQVQRSERRPIADPVAQGACERADGDVRDRELLGGPQDDWNSHDALCARNDYRTVLYPNAVGEVKNQRIDRSVDAAVAKICRRVRGQAASVDHDGDRRRWWEYGHAATIYRIA